MNSAKLLIAILFILGGVLLWFVISFPVPTETEIKPTVHEMVEEPLIVEPEELDTTTWTTSREHFTIDVPSDWNVEQKDAGGRSIILIFPESDDKEGIQIQLAASRTLAGTPIDFSAWMNEQLVTADKLDFCTTKVLGGIDVECVVAHFGEESEFALFGEIDALTFLHAKVRRVEEYELLFDSILATINFDPTEETLEEAEVIQ